MKNHSIIAYYNDSNPQTLTIHNKTDNAVLWNIIWTIVIGSLPDPISL